MMNFEWDIEKDQINIKKHGIAFVDASKVFLGDYLVYPSSNPGNDDKRFISIGEVKGVVITVIYTMRGSCYRLISARKARNEEKKEYSKAFSKRH